MLPTIGDGALLVVDKSAYLRLAGTPLEWLVRVGQGDEPMFLFGGPGHGDVAIFHSATTPGEDYIKRVIGLPGDVVQVEQGLVLVNGTPLDEPYVVFRMSPTGQLAYADLTVIVPDASYFVLGDNRSNSVDSRAGWLVPVDNLVGRAWLAYWPYAQFGAVGQPQHV